MNQTIKKIEKILTSSFDNSSFVDFVREIFPGVKIISPDSFHKEYSNFSSHIEGATHIGNYTDPDGKIIIIHSVRLVRESYVENSRSTQRSYAKKLMEMGNADAAIIAFYTKDDPKWRLSFVRLDYEIKLENGRLKTQENMTPAKRYSYLVGKDEPSHTAISSFRRFIVDDADAVSPTVDDLEEAFSVEKVTEEFFNLYCEKFYQLKEALDNNQNFVIEAKQNNFTSEQFAKKLMGQIVFLYFLQKKGWLGVSAWPSELNEKEYKNAFFAGGAKSRELIPKVYIKYADDRYHISAKALDSISDEEEKLLASCVKGQPWGSGSKTFMRTLFNYSQKKKANFFDDFLEPLFYDALNVNRGEQGYDPALHCRIPFLSGGLFEPIDGYDWEHNDFAIPNEIFSNKKDDNDREADGILDIFDRYNFTMSEDEPLEREVAIDPEMLGKVFENLLEVKDRKSKGAFYTPREIVHYMCQETLVSYLTDQTGLKNQDVRDFILLGDFLKDKDTTKDKRQGVHDMMISDEIFKIDQDGNIVVNRLKDIDDALANIRVADPAVGSGAFPLGMLNEIVRMRENISAYMAISMTSVEKKLMYSNERSPYALKRNTIQNCIFGADIEPSAVDIARLRLWLSLVIDDEIDPDAQNPLYGHRNPIPLPNLECNIVCGDSLIDVFEGHRLVPQSTILRTGKKGEEYNWHQNELETLIPKLIDAQKRLFNCDDTYRKAQIKEEVAAIEDEMIRTELDVLPEEVHNRYEESKRLASKPYVLWQIEFARVFREKGGFDAVIGNPPYIQLQKRINDTTGEKLGDAYRQLGFETFAKTGDIYCLFYEKGYQLLHQKGILTFITSNKWMKAGYGEKLRAFLADKTNPIRLVDFGNQKVFESATVDVNILSFEKSANKGMTLSCTVGEDCKNNLSVYIKQQGEVTSFKKRDSWVILSPIEENIRQKIQSVGTTLNEWNVSINYGIKTGLNEAFIISSSKKDELISKDPKSAELIRPILRGKDIKRYSYTFANQWIIVTHNGLKEQNIPPIDVNDYPAIKRYLDSYLPQLKKRSDKGDTPYNLRSCVYLNDFLKPKIVWGNLCLSAQFAYAEEDFFINAPSPMIVPGNKYILSILNSKIGDWYIRQLGVTRNGGYFEYKPMFVQQLPVPMITEEQQKPYISLVDEIIATKKQGKDTSRFEKKLDILISNLYGLSKAEYEYIDNN